MAISPKLRVDVNHNPTKKGIKVQFVLPTDVPYSNVIGFLIPIADIKLFIKNAISGTADAAPEEEPKA